MKQGDTQIFMSRTILCSRIL